MITHGRPVTTRNHHGEPGSERLKRGVKIANYGDHHFTMRKWVREIDPEPKRCPGCGQRAKMTLSLKDPGYDLLSGRFYIGYSRRQERGISFNAPYVLSVSPHDYEWRCTWCNMKEGQPLMRHNPPLVVTLAINGFWGEPSELANAAYTDWAMRHGQWLI